MGVRIFLLKRKPIFEKKIPQPSPPLNPSPPAMKNVPSFTFLFQQLLNFYFQSFSRVSNQKNLLIFLSNINSRLFQFLSDFPLVLDGKLHIKRVFCIKKIFLSNTFPSVIFIIRLLMSCKLPASIIDQNHFLILVLVYWWFTSKCTLRRVIIKEL